VRDPGLPLDSSHFTWERWRGGAFTEVFGVPHRTVDIERAAARIAQRALGFARGESLPCRPKPGTYAMMFETEDGRFVWCHITPREFQALCHAAD
jgi:hypothetical protein